jgi:hypothetical protein
MTNTLSDDFSVRAPTMDDLKAVVDVMDACDMKVLRDRR